MCALRARFDEFRTGKKIYGDKLKDYCIKWVKTKELNGSNHPHGAMIFDTANTTGGDSDLATPGYHASNTVARGKVLIISEDGDDSDPDDDAGGGKIYFKFEHVVDLTEAGLLDIDDVPGTRVITKDAGGNTISNIAVTAMGDNSYQTIAVNGIAVKELIVKFTSSGAIMHLCHRCPYCDP